MGNFSWRKKPPGGDEERQFRDKVRRIDRVCIGVLVNIAVSCLTTLAVLGKLGF